MVWLVFFGVGIGWGFFGLGFLCMCIFVGFVCLFVGVCFCLWDFLSFCFPYEHWKSVTTEFNFVQQ